MSSFDAKLFAESVLINARVVLRDARPEPARFPLEQLAMQELQDTVEATLAALEVERDSRRACALMVDLEAELRRGKMAVLNSAKATLAIAHMLRLERALQLTIEAALIVARAFFPSGGARGR
jgi:hypothetical protein